MRRMDRRERRPRWGALAVGVGLVANSLSGPVLASGPSAQLPDGLYAQIVTAKGTIVVRLEPEKTPMTVASFVGLTEGTVRNSIRAAGEPAFDGAVFHRVVPGHVIQAGEGAGFSYPNEIHADLSHDHAGAIGIPNSGPHTNSAGFYITLGDRSYLDGNYNVFGDVVEGMDVVMAIEADDVVERVRIVRVGGAADAYHPDTRSFFALVRQARRGVEISDARRILATERWLAERYAEMHGEAPGVRQQVLRLPIDAAGTGATDGQYMVRYQGVALRWLGHIVGRAGAPLHEMSFVSGADAYPGFGETPVAFAWSVGETSVNPGIDAVVATMRPGEVRRIFLPPWEAYGSGGHYGPDEPGRRRFVISPQTALLVEVEVLPS